MQAVALKCSSYIVSWSVIYVSDKSVFMILNLRMMLKCIVMWECWHILHHIESVMHYVQSHLIQYNENETTDPY